MRRIDELHLQWPFLGSRMLRNMLRLEGIAIGRKHVATLMRKMGIEAIYRRANTSRRHPRHAIYPYLLRNLTIDRPNQVWSTDVTYIPMARGFVYLVAVIDWFSRRVLSWRVSNSMTADFCVEALEEAISRYGAPEIFNTTRARNLPQQASSMCCRETKSASAWMDAVRGATTCSSSGCGSRLSTKRSICMRTTPSRRPRQAFNAIFPSTTAGVRTHHLTERRPITFTSTLSRSRRLHNPRSSTYPDREICLNLWDHLSHHLPELLETVLS